MRAKEKLDVYEKVASQIRAMIVAGVFSEGEKLPSVRSYAVEMRVNPNTVAKAYAVLEKDGYIVVQPKKGAFVLTPKGIREHSDVAKQLLAWKNAGVKKERLLDEIQKVYGREYD